MIATNLWLFWTNFPSSKWLANQFSKALSIGYLWTTISTIFSFPFLIFACFSSWTTHYYTLPSLFHWSLQLESLWVSFSTYINWATSIWKISWLLPMTIVMLESLWLIILEKIGVSYVELHFIFWFSTISFFFVFIVLNCWLMLYSLEYDQYRKWGSDDRREYARIILGSWENHEPHTYRSKNKVYSSKSHLILMNE